MYNKNKYKKVELGEFWCPQPDRASFILVRICTKYQAQIKRSSPPHLILSCSLNSCLNGFALGEEIFSIGGREEEKKKPSRREGYYCFNPLTRSHFKTGCFGA